METAIVIGGGPAGLIAAAHLAEAGVKTTLYEAKATLGGRAASDERDGFVLNQGPHALYAGGPAMRELKALGIDPPRWNPTSPTRSVLLEDGGTRRLARGSAAIVKLLRADAPPSMTTSEWLAANTSPKQLPLAEALVRVTTFVADHDALPADVAQMQMRLGVNPGVRYLKGGWQWLVDALAAQATRRGATIETRRSVTDLSELHADAVILATGLPDQAAKLAPEVVAPGPPAVISSLDLALRDLPNRTTFALGLDQPTYYSRHSPPNHEHHLMTAMSYAAAPLDVLEGIADTVHPGWRDQVLFQRHLPKMVPISAIASPTARPPVTLRPGLLVAGDWVGDEGWLVDAALASGVAAAKAAIDAPVLASAA